ncbi:hypothetical protein CH366_04440 [Leptospira harrisiae]|uniref:Uncharacterized protein n=2 Tax=Leptospira harrisiae TaxID=2023189 RepID=A0A2N0AQD8_9LEPT|nr:hypothetical protein CH364_04300 [Leptospira harrisiae]PKA08993.1 hypothetical protein CH366_04440 [Leptospira harrisiae]
MYNGQEVDLTILLWNSIVVILAVSLACYLASYHQTILFITTTTISLIAAFQFIFLSHYDSIAIMGFSKLILLLPLGLGAVIGYVSLPESKQQKFLPWFNRYINFAVIGNIFVMIFSPDGGTYRGIVSRFACFFLLIWLLQEMGKVRFQTTQTDQRIFTFNSSPLSWIYCHAAYRIALLSLPTFDSSNYLLLEPMSIVVMIVLYHLNQKRYPLPYYFGFADTIVVTTLTVLIRYPISLPFDSKGPYVTNLTEHQWDMVFLPIQLIVIGFVLRAIYKNLLLSKHINKWV